MFGPSSSPPVRVSNDQEEQLKGALLPAFGFECSDSFFSKPREFVRPKSQIAQPNFSAPETTPGFLLTPMPTSEANMQASSPPRSPLAENREISISHVAAPPVDLTPVSHMVVVHVPANGDKVTVGRSSKSSSFALRASNRLASRVHASLWFDAAHDRLSIECLGWNGLMVNVPGCPESNNLKNSFEIVRGQILNVEGIEGVVLDVHGDRALVEVANGSNASEVTEDEAWSVIGSSPLKRKRGSPLENEAPGCAPKLGSPLPVANESGCRYTSVEPVHSEDITLANTSTNGNGEASSPALPSDLPTDVWNPQLEIGDESEKVREIANEQANVNAEERIDENNVVDKTELENTNTNENTNKNTNENMTVNMCEKVNDDVVTEPAAELVKEHANDEPSKPVEAVDPPTVTAAVTESPSLVTKEIPTEGADRLEESVSSSLSEPTKTMVRNTIKASLSRSSSRAASEDPEHDTGRKIRRQFEPISEQLKTEFEDVIVNLIAFSRSSAVPLNAVRKANHSLHQLPKRQVMAIVKDIACIGVIEGAVEDTTARKADDEYYYIPELDANEERRRAVQGTRGHRSLRNCRKTSKQYYYRPLQLD